MNTIGLFYGSDTGTTEEIANKIKEAFESEITLHNIADTSKQDIQQYSKLILASPTWGSGDLQSDWEDFESTLEEIDFKDKTIALVGLGDQEAYSDTFCNALGHLYNYVKDANIIGFTSTKGYDFIDSNAVKNEQFVGLVLDEENQDELTEERIKSWVSSIKNNF